MVFGRLVALALAAQAMEATRRGRLVGAAVPQATRRGLVGSAGAAVAAALVGPVEAAEEASLSASSAPRVTAVVTLDLSIARAAPSPLRIELFGDAAPESVAYFSRLASGTLRAECADEEDDGSTIARTATSRRMGARACLDMQGVDVGFANSQLWRLVPDKRVDFGRVDSSFVARVPPTFAAETNDLRPSAKGAVSVKRGGGAFEFTVAPKENPALDKEDLVVVGRVASADVAFLDELNAIPTKKDLVSLSDVPPLGGKFTRACEYAAPDPTCAQFKPLKRIMVVSSAVAPRR